MYPLTRFLRDGVSKDELSIEHAPPGKVISVDIIDYAAGRGIRFMSIALVFSALSILSFLYRIWGIRMGRSSPLRLNSDDYTYVCHPCFLLFQHFLKFISSLLLLCFLSLISLVFLILVIQLENVRFRVYSIVRV